MKLSIAVLSLAVGVAACSEGRATEAAQQDDFKRDLQLASSTNLDLAGHKVDPSLLSSLETQPKAAPIAAVTVKKGAGNRAVRSQTPTVRATPTEDVAAIDDAADEVVTIEEVPVPEPTSEPVAVAPRPTPVGIPAAGGGSGDYGTSGNGGGVWGTGGGIGGVVIRGGGVDGDHCEIHGTGRGGRMGGPVYVPSVPRTGGIFIGSRIPSRRAIPQQTARGGFSRGRLR
jgi:hypothetical protein